MSALFVRQVLVKVIFFAGNIILARLLAPEIFGIYAIVSLLSVFFHIWRCGHRCGADPEKRGIKSGRAFNHLLAAADAGLVGCRSCLPGGAVGIKGLPDAAAGWGLADPGDGGQLSVFVAQDHSGNSHGAEHRFQEDRLGRYHGKLGISSGGNYLCLYGVSGHGVSWRQRSQGRFWGL